VSADFTDALFARASGRERNPLRIGLWLVLSGVLLFVASIPLAFGMLFSPLDPEVLSDLVAGRGLPEGPERLRQEAVLVALVAASLAAGALAALVAGRVAFGRPMGSFLTPAAPFRPSLLLAGAVVVAVILSGALAADVLLTARALEPPLLDAAYTAADRRFYAGVTLVALLFAAAAEEVIFRGVILQVTGAFTRSVLPLALLNGLLFSAIHLDFDPAPFLARAVMGAAFTWTVLKLGGLEFAIGAHLANNLVICWFVAPLSGAMTEGVERGSLTIDLVMCVALVAAVLALSRTRAVQRWKKVAG
jgi:uncharacterized protein